MYVIRYTKKIPTKSFVFVGDSLHYKLRGRLVWEFCNACGKSRVDHGFFKPKMFTCFFVEPDQLLFDTEQTRIYSFCNDFCLQVFFLQYPEVHPCLPKEKSLEVRESIKNVIDYVFRRYS